MRAAALLLAVAACGADDELVVSPPRPRPDARLAAAVVDAAAAPVGPAELVLNEVAANQDGLRDLVELRVVSGGTTAGWRLERSPRDPVVLATLPDGVVRAGELLVVHLDAERQEIPYTHQVLTLRAPSGALSSAVPFMRPELVDRDRQPRDFPANLQHIIDAKLWSPACAPAPCSYESNLAEVAVSWAGLGTTPDGASVARVAAGSGEGSRAEWRSPAPSTWGAANPP